MLFVGVKLGGHNLFSFLFFWVGWGIHTAKVATRDLGGGGAEVREVSGFLFKKKKKSLPAQAEG